MIRLFIALVAVSLIAADWPQHLGPLRDGKSPETGLLKSWPKSGPAIEWSRPVGRGWSGAVVVGERAYIFHRKDADEVLECLAVDTGKLLWKVDYPSRYVDDFQFDDGPRSTPLVANDRIFTLGAAGRLSAWDAATGKAIWHRDLVKDYEPAKGFFGTATSPIIAGGKLLINVGAKGAGIVAFDPATGKEHWKSTDESVSYSSPISVEIHGESLAVFFTRGGLVGINPDKGSVRFEKAWRPRLDASVNAATPVAFGNRLFVSTSYGTGGLAVEVKKGGELDELWSGDRSLSCHYNTPVVIDGTLYGVDGRQEGGRAQLRAVDLATGKVHWSQQAFGCAGLIFADGLLIATAENGDLVLMKPDVKGYQEVSRASLAKAPVRALPALSNGRLLVRDGGTLYAVRIGKK